MLVDEPLDDMVIGFCCFGVGGVIGTYLNNTTAILGRRLTEVDNIIYFLVKYAYITLVHWER
jgi:hypothetical protein